VRELSSNALAVAESRYIRNDNDIGDENWEGCLKRVAKAIASVEIENKEYWEEKFFDMLINMKALPGGRTLRNAGTPSNKILNCHVLELPDDIYGIGEFLKRALVLNAEGGGVGCLPKLRPKGALIKTRGGESSGLLSFLRIISNALDIIETGGSRRSGLLPIVPISHPEVLDFIDSKLNHDELNNFNISVGVTNEFLDCVEQKYTWKFTFDGKDYGSMWAVDLFDKIIANNMKSGEPGIVNLDNMMISNSYYFSPISCFTGDTLISTTKGLVRVEELVGDEFECVTNLKCIYSNGSFIEKATASYSGEDEVFEVKLTNNQSINLTKDHKVWTQVGWKSVKDLNIGNDFLYVQNSISPHFVSNLSKKEDIEDGFVIGYLVGDGNISLLKNSSSKSAQYSFCAHESGVYPARLVVLEIMA